METYLKELEGHLAQAIARFKEEARGVRSGRPTTQLIENINVTYAEQNTPLKQIASLSVRPPREIVVTAWDPQAVPAIMKAIQDSKVGLSLSNEGTMIRCFLPPLTEERREELTKFVKKMAEEVRIQVRGNRDEVNKKLKAAEAGKELSEDQVFKARERIQKFVDQTNGEIEALVKSKLTELQD